MNWRFWKRRSEDLPDPSDPNWERAVLGQMAAEYLRERRRRRKWATFFKAVTLTYLFLLLISFYFDDLAQRITAAGEGHTALVEVKGVIAPETQASADLIVTSLRNAFDDAATKGVILRINSPGGSPVQAGYINDEIKRLKAKYKEEHEKEMPVYAVAVDTCASGAYYIAVAADEIYADKASLIGSIGVRLDSFGFDQLIDELGIERRLLTAGENKAILDPFLPLDPSERDFLLGVLDEIHGQFIDAVKAGRGERLKDDDRIFSGLFWTGEQGVDLGLVDGLGSSSYVARELIGAETIVDFTKKWDLVDRFAERLGAKLTDALMRFVGLAGEHSLR